MPHKTDIHVGSKLRAARLAKSYSQDDLGKILGISFQQVQKYEKGTNRVGASRLWDISIALDVPIEFFFEGLKENDTNNNTPNHGALSRRTIDMAQRIDRIEDDKIRNQILNLIRACSS